jgi:tetrahydrodipicolinate N-succinyltransferase
MLRSFTSGIEKVIDQTLELVDYYRKSAKMRMNKRIAQEWSKVLPQNVFPHCMKMDKNTNEVMLLREDNLWESFNQITETAWHNNKSEYLTKSHVEQNAHRVLIAAVQGRYA